MEVENQNIEGPNPGIIEVPITQTLLTIGTVERLSITKINARLHQQIKR